MIQVEQAKQFIAEHKQRFSDVLEIEKGYFALEVVERKRPVGSEKIGHKLYFTGHNEKALSELIDQAQSDRASWEALRAIFKDLCELARPIPKPLAEWADKAFNGDIKRPRMSQVYSKQSRDLIITIIANKLKASDIDIAIITSDNRAGESIAGLIGEAFNVSPGAVRKIMENYIKQSSS